MSEEKKGIEIPLTCDKEVGEVLAGVSKGLNFINNRYIAAVKILEEDQKILAQTKQENEILKARIAELEKPKKEGSPMPPKKKC